MRLRHVEIVQIYKKEKVNYRKNSQFLYTRENVLIT